MNLKLKKNNNIVIEPDSDTDSIEEIDSNQNSETDQDFIDDSE